MPVRMLRKEVTRRGSIEFIRDPDFSSRTHWSCKESPSSQDIINRHLETMEDLISIQSSSNPNSRKKPHREWKSKIHSPSRLLSEPQNPRSRQLSMPSTTMWRRPPQTTTPTKSEKSTLWSRKNFSILEIHYDRPLGTKKAYITLTGDSDAMTLASKIGLIWFLCLTCYTTK